jgi:hypothetical protein
LARFCAGLKGSGPHKEATSLNLLGSRLDSQNAWPFWNEGGLPELMGY